MTAAYHRFDPLLPPAQAEAMLRLCERFGDYGMYSQEASAADIGQGLFQRHDAVMNFVRTGGRSGRRESLESLGARTNYFRESYAYGNDVRVEGIEPFLRYEGFVEAARAIHGRPVVEPAIVYANLLVPGQELAVHTDVPEFRGANRRLYPQWLMVVMHHSGLFDAHRMPIATAVGWFNDCRGGDFVFYPEGADGPAVTIAARANTGIILDTDSVFHGVDPVWSAGPLPALRPGLRLCWAGDRWVLRDGAAVIARWGWDEVRFSISWKAYCFTDAEERRAWREHRDDLVFEHILDRLVDDLRARGRLHGDRPPPTSLALMLIDEYVKFPPPAV
ncbi:MAG TPA: hypothetical protein VE997_02825 [Candidatus Limnocylindria bacterium]|nr:hypothetical protein [Candidatus Limnocylindria bacterium]